MVHREQEIKQLQGWAQTVQNLINKFEDALQELGPLAALEDGLARSCSPDEENPPEEGDGTAGANRALVRHAGSLTQHCQALNKLRQHFQKVSPLQRAVAVFSCMGAVPQSCSSSGTVMWVG